MCFAEVTWTALEYFLYIALPILILLLLIVIVVMVILKVRKVRRMVAAQRQFAGEKIYAGNCVEAV